MRIPLLLVVFQTLVRIRRRPILRPDFWLSCIGRCLRNVRNAMRISDIPRGEMRGARRPLADVDANPYSRQATFYNPYDRKQRHHIPRSIAEAYK